MSYLTIKKMFYVAPQPSVVAVEREAERRRNSPSALRWNYKIGEHQMFSVVTPRMLSLTEKIFTDAGKIQKLFSKLPTGAATSYVQSEIIEELQHTNEIENVHSTRKELHSTLETLEGMKGKSRFGLARCKSATAPR